MKGVAVNRSGIESNLLSLLLDDLDVHWDFIEDFC